MIDVGHHPAAPAAQPPAPVEPVTVKTPRVAGKMYVVIQSFNEHEQDAAEKTADALNRAGVPCSVVQSLKDYVPRGFYSVVGFQPFTTVKNNPALQDYAHVLAGLGPKITGRGTGPFHPQLYTWRTDAEQEP